MKALSFISILSLLLIGCSKPEDQAAVEPEQKTLSLFKEDKGVFLPEEMQTRFAVQLSEVIETNLPVKIEKQAQLYRAASDHAPAIAAALLTEAEARIVKTNQSVELIRDGTTFAGRVSQVDRSTEKAAGQSEVLIEFADAGAHFAPGDFVTARFVVSKKESAVVIPKSALLTAAIGNFVYAVNGKHFLRTRVATGAENESSIEIVDGLYAGDVVVANAVSDLWLIELQATKTGQPCCVAPKKN